MNENLCYELSYFKIPSSYLPIDRKFRKENRYEEINTDTCDFSFTNTNFKIAFL